MQRDRLQCNPRVCALALVLAVLGCDGAGEDVSAETGDVGGTSDTGTALVSGDGVRGGALYDSWWAVTGAAAPTTDHPLWASRPDTTSNTSTGADTWRCQECHGWDYEGVDGAYAEGEHKTGIIGIRDTSKTTSEILALLEDPAGHDYGSVLDEQELADLAIFVSEWTLDPSLLIDDSGLFMGEPSTGADIFMTSCALCHGDQGLALPPGADPGFEQFPGLIATENPWEFLHKVRFGQPGTAMPAQAMALTTDEQAHLGAFAQTLPNFP